MTIAEILEAREKDLGRINKADLIAESANLPFIQNKFRREYTAVRLYLLKLREEQIVLNEELGQYYSGNGKDEVVKRKGVCNRLFKTNDAKAQQIKADKEMIELQRKIDLGIEKLQLLEDTLRDIVTRGFTIKNMNDSAKWLAGD